MGIPELTYQWRRNGANLLNGTNYVLPLLSVSAADAGAYTVVLSNAMGRVTSAPAQVTVTTPPTLVAHPSSVQVVEGRPALFAVSATGSPPFSYQWRLNGVDLTGEINSSLNLASAQLVDAGAYSVVVANGAGMEISDDATLTVLEALMFQSSATDTNVDLGASVTFCVTVSGSGPLRYQWRKNGVNLPNGTNNCHTIPTVTSSDGGRYTVVVANPLEAITSPPANLTVNLPSATASDNLADRTTLSAASVRSNNTGATRETSEPNHAGKPGGTSIWYSLTPGESGVVTMDTQGSAFDTLLAVYTGTQIGDLVEVASDEDRGGFFTSLLQFDAVQGQEYLVAVDGYHGASGEVVLSWSIDSVQAPLPMIADQPDSLTVAPGAAATFEAIATTSGGTLGYQWYYNGTLLGGETGTMLSLASVAVANVGAYHVVVSNSLGGVVRSQDASLELGDASTLRSKDKFPDLFLAVGGGGQPGGGNGGSLPGSFVSVSLGGAGFHIFDNLDSTSSDQDALVSGSIGGSSQYIGRFQAGAPGTMVFDTLGSTFDTTMAVYTVANDMITGLVGSDDNGASDGVASRFAFETAASEEYVVAVDRAGSEAGIVQLNWNLGRAADDTVEAVPASAALGSELLLSAQISGVAPEPEYQWLKDGMTLGGETGRTLTLSSLAAEDGGLYAVVIRNALGVVTQEVARVTVDADQQVSVSSAFSVDAQQWSILQDGAFLAPAHAVTGGNGGGYAYFTDGANPAAWHWMAPPEYLGNQSALYGGHLRVDLLRTPTATQVNEPAVMLMGAGEMLYFDLPIPPADRWTTYQVPLVETGGWWIGDPLGAAPTKSEMLRVLSAVEAWLIPGDFSLEPHTTGIDNVELSGPVETETVLLIAQLLPGGVVRLEWPESAASFQLESAPAGTADLKWLPLLVSPSAQDGMRRVEMPLSGEILFFRLRKP